MAAPNKTSKLFTSRLPLELILEIFSYLPTKSLKRLRYVFDNEFPSFSKSLETYSFQHKHAANVSTNPTSVKFLIKAEYPHYIIHEIDSYPFKPPSITHSYNYEQLFKNIIIPCDSEKSYGGEVIGGCNGLICLFFEIQVELKKRDDVMCPCCIPRETFHHLKLWNPCTGEHHAIPTPQGFRFELFNDDMFSDDVSITLFGFGYDFVNKTYKLVIGQGAITQFYDWSTDAWKIVETIDINWDKFCIFMSSVNSLWQSQPQSGYYFNGALHWIVSSTSIVSIDLSTEVSNFINMPHCCSSKEDQHGSNMGVVKGCLSVSCHRFLDKKVSIWVMKEYGREESWTNILNITLSESDITYGSPDLMVIRPPLWVSQDNEMLFLIQGKLAYWNAKAQEFNYVKGLQLFDSQFRGIVHFDTLVSPNPEVYRLGGGESSGNVKVLVSK
ncbi:F-box/kelch-repeat protein At3g23880-like [Silene latifolia]|uniref:F-box/kelch-repeat protein At3g23880-like n=1 Tax=Silene latifolia TaxID=37657 RepID=UPI003D783F87